MEAEKESTAAALKQIAGDNQPKVAKIEQPKALAVFKNRKEVSLDAKLEAIRQAFYDDFSKGNSYGPWTKEIFESYLIANDDGKLFRVPYAKLDENITFSSRPDWTEVEVEYRDKELFIWKEGDTYRWMAAYSNNRRDDDSPPEIISTESHKEFDTALHKGEWPMPELWLWHIPYPVGTTQYHAFDESTGFPVAAGTFNKGSEWAAEGIMQAGWDGVSHGMPDAWIKRDDKDKSIIVRHRTKEITFLPLWAAANKLAFSIISKEASMSDEKGLPAHKRAEFITAFGEEKVKQMEDTLEDKSKAADEAGIQKKEETPATETPAAPALTPDSEIVKALGTLAEQIAGMRNDFDTRIKALESGVTEVKEKQAADEPFDLMEFLKSKSAIGAPEAKVDGRTTLAKDGPTETPQTVARPGGLNLTVVDELMGINQAWAEKRGMN
jgi:hypothetical protein